jgi:hypothetical protein
MDFFWDRVEDRVVLLGVERGTSMNRAMSHYRMRRFHFALSLVFLLVGGLCSQAQRSSAPVSNAALPHLKFSGTLTDDSGKPRSGVVGVTFFIYKD